MGRGDHGLRHIEASIAPMRAAERNAAFRDARNLEDEHSHPDTPWRARPSDAPRTQLVCGRESPSSRLRVTLDDPGQVILLSGTQVEVLAVACRHLRDDPSAPRTLEG